jgi:hypothetical protein
MMTELLSVIFLQLVQHLEQYHGQNKHLPNMEKKFVHGKLKSGPISSFYL